MLSGRQLSHYVCELQGWYDAGQLDGLGTVRMGDVESLLSDLDEPTNRVPSGPPPPIPLWRRDSDENGDVLPLRIAVIVAVNDFYDLLDQLLNYDPTDQAVNDPDPPVNPWRRVGRVIERLHQVVVERLGP